MVYDRFNYLLDGYLYSTLLGNNTIRRYKGGASGKEYPPEERGG
jgi:hypothetical protein